MSCCVKTTMPQPNPNTLMARNTQHTTHNTQHTSGVVIRRTMPWSLHTHIHTHTPVFRPDVFWTNSCCFLYIEIAYENRNNEKAYFGPDGFGSLQETLKDAKRFDDTITYEDVWEWKGKQDFGQKQNHVVTLILSHRSLIKNTNAIYFSALSLEQVISNIKGGCGELNHVFGPKTQTLYLLLTFLPNLHKWSPCNLKIFLMLFKVWGSVWNWCEGFPNQCTCLLWAGERCRGRPGGVSNGWWCCYYFQPRGN